jgi:peptide/nickel transport system permease protein
MTRYLLRRLAQAVPTLFGITLLSFLLMLATPGDPVTLITFNPNATPEGTAILRRQLGLDQPPLVQYIYWLVGNDWVKVDAKGDGTGTYGTRYGLLRGDFGQSIILKRPVLDVIAERVPATLLLTGTAVLVGYVVGIILGLFAALFHRSLFDQLVRVLSVLGNAIPGFWLGLILIIIFSVQLGVLPMSGMRDITKPSAGFNLQETIPYMIMPVTVIALGIIASISRYTRVQVLEVLSQDYVRTAYSKGLANRRVYFGHIARNALIPIVTLLGVALGSLIGGAVIIEQVFNWPGLGRLVIEAVSTRDYPLIMGSVVIGSVLYIAGLLISDMLYVVVDPRIRL